MNFSLENLEEASMNFDLEHVASFLERIVLYIDEGFSGPEIKEIQNKIEGMEHEEELEAGSFDIVYQRQKTKLMISVFMDSPGSPDLYIYTDPELAGQIEEEMSRFADEMEEGY
ncbi:hypothetical protein GKZ89_18265 [Bacillus mangrovi]|uniref:Uncharacterized protein n=1 Tax=Metabacillus mangrovi TaxID=1491830 RepID=A0A7X2S8I7_9BACI|nr:hypothetical protein [Metabacillus mangrovi]MTH55342.1 hypothetical protein [Metabacillus mangrovi]